jgi:hypothetical protein
MIGSLIFYIEHIKGRSADCIGVSCTPGIIISTTVITAPVPGRIITPPSIPPATANRCAGNVFNDGKSQPKIRKPLRAGSKCISPVVILVLTAFTICRAMGPVKILSVEAEATILTVSEIKKVA